MLAGCHTQKQMAQPTNDDPVDQPKIEQTQQTDVPVCLYGPPPTGV